MRAAGWYPGPGGDLLRWWTGWMWGPDVAAPGTKPLPPPVRRRYLPYTSAAAETQVLTLPPTADVPLGTQDAPADRRAVTSRRDQ
jgi:hypothetical protein